MENIKLRYCVARYLPLKLNKKDYTFVTTIDGLEPGDAVFYIANDVLHEVVFLKYCKKPRAKYHYKMLIGRRCLLQVDLNESIAIPSE